MVTDNAPYFVSEEIELFFKQNGIHHPTSLPYHPASNGLVERAVQTIKKGLRKVTEGTLTTPLYISNEHFWSISQKLNVHVLTRWVRAWCHFKVTNNVYWWHSKGKNCGYKLHEWLYGLSYNGFIVLWLSRFEFWRLAALLHVQKHLKECLPPFLTIFKVVHLWALLLNHLWDYGTWQKFSSWFECEA